MTDYTNGMLYLFHVINEGERDDQVTDDGPLSRTGSEHFVRGADDEDAGEQEYQRSENKMYGIYSTSLQSQ